MRYRTLSPTLSNIYFIFPSSIISFPLKHISTHSVLFVAAGAASFGNVADLHSHPTSPVDGNPGCSLHTDGDLKAKINTLSH